MADDKTTKTPERPVTDTGPVKETPPTPSKEPEKVSVSPEPEKKTEPEVKNPQVSVYNFTEIMKEKKVEERAAAPSGEKPAPAKTEKPEKQPALVSRFNKIVVFCFLIGNKPLISITLINQIVQSIQPVFVVRIK